MGFVSFMIFGVSLHILPHSPVGKTFLRDLPLLRAARAYASSIIPSTYLIRDGREPIPLRAQRKPRPQGGRRQGRVTSSSRSR